MAKFLTHRERHSVSRVGWLRAAVLGADDGIVSTSSLIIGVVAAQSSLNAAVTAGIAGIAAGAMSMAAGEFVSVSSQKDAEHADIAREAREIDEDPEHEHVELRKIYEARGLDRDLADQVATKLMERDPLAAHLRDELGISEQLRARPLQAAIVSALAFTVGALLPLLALLVTQNGSRAVQTTTIALAALTALAASGAVAARLGRAPIAKAALRVTVGGGLAMAVTYLIGRLVGAAV
ncbi:MAG: VIT1/CCC1 transporter family protein [Acidimicrobiia bacterium]